ncbi:MAG: hypothetical protein A3G52_00705 [Candidatus Taylorbacteria bacterium RIFCSPLOWO2_12_FULL_43_20]|uniref:LamG-like jellyroll fold domain-containing protein n=1 Tax=Candidatus Taylorbacteria bacterium RIFCSPLOWO2_12_FULL_43_20 TaxID=1802332 RepID=A0A1G2P1X3_9BACT|nr:MAG: hypothetical protein A3E92_04060 [Candidatus Taylorbacteria bacterium RIFCSPHIGHO2_12_FULL_42_34]OHA37585.1 MAG: hypothetical protein A3H58_02065 [Candidatus Taylorbacteria bacterium RIFCSPLOWO2_02_FULL_43_22b]OHA41612.1 MAG: hypothetical protein A3G52_00705 [Candidatus Taylorbacteria bacterium RIFCSPLOWO2_12_FULL_43_20]
MKGPIKTSHGIAIIGTCFLITLLFINWAGRQIDSYVLSAPISPSSQIAAISGAGSGLVLHYSFDEGSGSLITDLSGSGNDTTLSGTTAWVTGKVGSSALDLGSVDNLVDSGSEVIGTNPFTICMWVYPHALSANNSYFAYNSGHTFGGGILLYVITNNRIKLSTINGTITSNNNAVSLVTWTHICTTRDPSNNGNLYANGQLTGTPNVDLGTPTIGSENLIFGNRAGGGRSFKGYLDDVRVYNRALSASEIGELYALGGGTPPPSDTTPPSISNGSPSGSLSSGTAQTTLSVTTNEGATCKYSTSANTAYSSIANTFSTTGNTSHSTTVTGLTDGSSYTYYVRCQDSVGNQNTSDYSVSFSVSSAGGGDDGGGETPVSPPDNPSPGGPVTYYVDQNHPSSNDNNTGTESLPFKTIQAAANIVDPGDTVLIKAGTYQDQLSYCVGAQCRLVFITRSGTAGNPITFKAYGDDSVILTGFGFEDRDLDEDGYADGPTYSNKRERMIMIKANYIRIENLEITNSSGSGIIIDGSFNVVKNVHVHNLWGDGIAIGDTGENRVEGNVVDTVEIHNSRHNGGVSFYLPLQSTEIITNNLVTNSIAYMNGRHPDGTKVLPLTYDPAGGGNSDGFGASKNCADTATFTDVPYDNMCPKNVFRGNVTWLNADDGFDMSMADSLVEGNISFGNGPAGRKGFKVLRQVTDLRFVGNIAYANLGVGFEPRVTSGGVFLNNLAISNDAQGFSGISGVGRNNMSYGNSSNDLPNSTCDNCSNNWIGNGSGTFSGNPSLANLTPFQDGEGNITVTFPPNLTIAEKVAWIKEQFRVAFTPQSTSAAINAGVSVSYIDPISGETLQRTFYGSSPDIGAYEYVSGSGPTPPTNSAPSVSAGPDRTLELPTNSLTLTGGASDDGLPQGSSLSVTWSKVSGTGNVTFSSANSLSTTATFSTTAGSTGSPQGTYVLRLTATDGTLTSTDEVTITVTQDSTPPVRSGGTPGDTLPHTTTQTTLSLTTNEASTCRYGTSPNTAYASLPSTFTTTGNTSHSSIITSISSGSYTYYVKCSDSLNNANTTDYTISFSIAGAPQTPDADGDGIADGTDLCPNTPSSLSSQVNRYGCPRPLAAKFDQKPNFYELDLRSLPSLYLGISTYGKIDWNTPLVLLRDSVSGYKDRLDFDSTIDISYHKITLNSSSLPELSKPATLTFYDINYIQPKILKDGSICSSSVCTNTTYANRELTVTVPSFSTYEVKEGYVPSTSGGGGSGGGSSSGTPASQETVILPVQTPVCTPSVIQSSQPAYNFSRNLTVGSRGEDVRQLQIFLNNNGYTIASVGVGSPGQESDYFGNLTKSALIRYQNANRTQILTPVNLTQGTGFFGASTIQYINSLQSNQSNQSPTTDCIPATAIPSNSQFPTPSLPAVAFGEGWTRDLALGSRGEDVRNLQKFLNSQGFTVSNQGVGSKGNETDYYGPATHSALIRFQNYYRDDILTPVGLTQGTGYFGPSTRGKVKALLD